MWYFNIKVHIFNGNKGKTNIHVTLNKCVLPKLGLDIQTLSEFEPIVDKLNCESRMKESVRFSAFVEHAFDACGLCHLMSSDFGQTTRENRKTI